MKKIISLICMLLVAGSFEGWAETSKIDINKAKALAKKGDAECKYWLNFEMFEIEESDDLEGLPILDMVAIEGRDNFKSFFIVMV